MFIIFYLITTLRGLIKRNVRAIIIHPQMVSLLKGPMTSYMYVIEDVFSHALYSVENPPPGNAKPTIPALSRVQTRGGLYKEPATSNDGIYWQGILYRNRRYEIPAALLSETKPDIPPGSTNLPPIVPVLLERETDVGRSQKNIQCD